MFFLVIVSSCKKEGYLSNDSYFKSKSIKEEFELKKIPDDALGFIQPIKSDTILWEIQWDSELKAEVKSGKTYIYIPIIPRLKSGKSKIRTYHYNRYLLFTKVNEKTHFYLASAYDDKLGGLTQNKFSGTLCLKNLDDNWYSQYHFINGSNAAPKSQKTMSIVKTMESADCIITYSCSWGTVCSGGIVYITATTGNSCEPPIMFDSCGNSSDIVPWSFNGSQEIGRTCFPDSPPVDPPSPLGGGGGDGGDNSNPTNNNLAETEPTTFNFALADPSDLKKHFKCFDQISDANIGAYLMSISVDLPVNNDLDKLVTTATVPPSPGHVFITLSKFSSYDPLTGITSITKSFGFYPSPEILSLTTQGVGSKIIDDGGRERNAIKNIFLTKEQFQQVMDNAIYLAGHKAYDINDYNCTDYAIDVWNTVNNETLSVSDWIGPTTQLNYGRTPNGLYKVLAQKKSYGDQSISLSSNDKAPAKTSSCE